MLSWHENQLSGRVSFHLAKALLAKGHLKSTRVILRKPRSLQKKFSMSVSSRVSSNWFNYFGSSAIPELVMQVHEIFPETLIHRGVPILKLSVIFMKKVLSFTNIQSGKRRWLASQFVEATNKADLAMLSDLAKVVECMNTPQNND